ncbi:MAG: ABC transporter ATP-binding protein [Roseobacter sp.]
MTDPLLRLSGISKTYGPVKANSDVNFVAEAGHIHAVLGENGAGKSTLMKIIYGVVRPDVGRVDWNGSPVQISSPAMARQLGIGMVFQHFSLFESLTVSENMSLALPGSLTDLAARIRTASLQFALDVEPNARVLDLTVGERQRIEILRCILQEPKLIILDEPTSVLPPQGIAKLFDTLRALAAKNIGVVFISHKLEEIRALCDTATVMRAGRVVGRVDPRKETAKSLTQLMIGQEISAPKRSITKTAGKTILEVSQLSHDPQTPYAPFLKNISLSLKAGDILGIAGVSGNGQGALTRVLAGEILTPSETVRFDGTGVGAMRPDERRKRGLSFIPEERLGRGAVPPHSLSENAGLTMHPRDILKWGFLRPGARQKRAEETIKNMDVRTNGSATAAQFLSGGNLQKFIVGRELALSPKVLIAAQPTWGVDVAAAAAIRQKFLELRDAGVALLIVSEELEELIDICDRLQVMFRGQLSPSVSVQDTDIEHIGLAMAGDFNALKVDHAQANI